jgi:hypothetical protein
VGRTEVAEPRRPFEIVMRRGVAAAEPEGAATAAGNLVGTYLHGLFANDGKLVGLRLDAAEGGAAARWRGTGQAGARRSDLDPAAVMPDAVEPELHNAEDRGRPDPPGRASAGARERAASVLDRARWPCVDGRVQAGQVDRPNREVIRVAAAMAPISSS